MTAAKVDIVNFADENASDPHYLPRIRAGFWAHHVASVVLLFPNVAK